MIGGKIVHQDEHAITVGGKWGYIDMLGNMIIHPQYDRAWEVKNGKAQVELDNKRFQIEIK